MSGRLFLCTSNRHKASEIGAVLGDDVVIVLPADLGVSAEVRETGGSFEENALIKARWGAATSGLPALGDDSGLCVDALDGAPGVRSARFALDHGRGRGDQDNNALLLERLHGVPDERRGAHFTCSLALCLPGGAERVFRGEVHGRIGRAPRGEHGFGYDPLFLLPDGRTMSELPADEKNRISHRGRALAAARDALREAARA
ncbi:MAG: RdgB/HAM1 family non-canonical purine NTP pyrophosphatase [Deltaproteobacteria bacterium]|nr:RdgB/HAM1 family non-canonical purine NTP pyrophosphatase [Deltaproteobacteria bacterium]